MTKETLPKSIVIFRFASLVSLMLLSILVCLIALMSSYKTATENLNIKNSDSPSKTLGTFTHLAHHLIISGLIFVGITLVVIYVFYQITNRYDRIACKRTFKIISAILKAITVITAAVSLIELATLTISTNFIGVKVITSSETYNFLYSLLIFPITALFTEFTLIKDIYVD